MLSLFNKVCMYNTYDCARIGVFKVNEACKSIDVTKDSKYLLAAATTFGYIIFDTHNGNIISRVELPQKGIQTKHVEFALGDDKFLIVYEQKRKSFVRIQDMKSALHGENTSDAIVEVEGPQDHVITQASWGPLNQTLYIVTDKGRVLIHDLASNQTLVSEDVHKGEIFSFTVTYDHTMLITCSKDGYAKLLHPRTLQ